MRTDKIGVELIVASIDQLKAWVGSIYIMPQFHRFDMIVETIEAVK